MGWHAHLALRYWADQGTTRAHDRHEGPLRVLQRLYPEGPAICHHVIVHPPGGIVGGDRLQVEATVGEGCHAVITTPGAARFYRSEGEPAEQQVRLDLAAGARLEWLPLETIAYSGCEARNQLSLTLAPGAQMLGWDVLALGLPAAQQPFVAGRMAQQLALPGQWLEAGLIDASDTLLLHSPLGLGGDTVLATAWWAEGEPLPRARRERLLEVARAAIEADPLVLRAGVTAAQEQVLVLRVLSSRVEPAMRLLQAVRAAWRAEAWGLAAEPPRIWRT
jgi:urease accessory protein